MAESMTEFAARAGVTMAVEPRDTNELLYVGGDEGRENRYMLEASHWTVTLRREAQTMAFPFTLGSAHPPVPESVELATVLDCLASDSSMLDQDPETLVSDMIGFEAVRMFEAVTKQRDALLALLGDELYADLLYETERE